ncbi:MAG: 4Fe-4S binding protein [Bacteroidales bacterium]|nr:4Fe-4S binding protein [Bacteroidales bacterium]
MGSAKKHRLVFTRKDLCRVCYTCVRECPVKAIRIANGQAEVISERCIGCGNCVKVCSQGAKTYLDSKQQVSELLKSGQRVAAIVAPSFPAEFTEINDYRVFVAMIRRLGFDLVVENAIGADLVAGEYEKIMDTESASPHISSDCPAIVYFIEQYYPQLVGFLAPVASPMVATARILKKKYGDSVQLVFIGPCIAKKAESDELNEVLTFTELRDMFKERGIDPIREEVSGFDPPHPGKGAIFPVSRGMLQTVNKVDDICEGNVVVAEGRVNFRDAVREFERGFISSHHLELLCCEGCIMGPGMSKGGRRYSRRTYISNYVREKLNKLNREEWKKDMEDFGSLDFSQSFSPADRRMSDPDKEKINEVLRKLGKESPADHLNCGACGYDTCIDHARAIINGLAEHEMCLPFTIEKLHHSIEELNASNDKLANARQALRHSEKLAHMGQLSAGIAHELNNPLGVITMYSNILKEETPVDNPLRKDLELIVEQADRCKNIVGGLLNFARKNQVRACPTHLPDFTQNSFESIIKPDNVDIKLVNRMDNPITSLDPEQMMQALTNLEKNAVEAMPQGGTLTIELSGNEDEVEIRVSDTGTGIPQENMEKMFTPFFTTKKPGKGTGLGLPLIYGIVKMHKGKIQVSSNTDAEKGPSGTSFTITLPRNTEI